MNALLLLDATQKTAGVVTHSSGNHAQALALAGRLLGIPVTIVMPRTAPAVKRAATEGYGAEIILCEPTLESREATVAAQIDRRGLALVHPYNDWNVIAGQGTAALEFLEQAGPIDALVAPVGGGGLLSGTALASRGRSPTTRVIGAEPERADDARRSLETGTIQPSLDPKTIADGLRTSLGTRTFAVISRHVDEIVTASEAEIINATRFVWERIKIVIEPSSAVAVAPLFSGRIPVAGGRIGVILSGGNIDVEPFFQALTEIWL
jgi:threonine dehydratase